MASYLYPVYTYGGFVIQWVRRFGVEDNVV